VVAYAEGRGLYFSKGIVPAPDFDEQMMA
jgi:hypothetical protein